MKYDVVVIVIIVSSIVIENTCEDTCPSNSPCATIISENSLTCDRDIAVRNDGLFL